MKVLVTTQPGLGHFFPLLPIGRALEAAGHEVAVAVSASFAPRVEAAGCRVFPAGLDWLESAPERAFPELADVPAAHRGPFILEVFADDAANQMAHDLLALCKEWRPDILVRESYEYGACIAAECLDLPHAVVGVEMFVIESFALDRSTRRWLEDQLAYLRSAFGLSPRPALDMLARHLYLSRIPSSYQFPGEPLPPVAHLVRPVPFDPPGGDALPGWVHDLPDRPTVYASMGTVFNRVPEVWRAIVDGLSGEPVNLVVTMGGADLPDWPGPLPGNVRIERFVPESALMPYCDLLISHGGIGTILKAMNSGLPVLVIPPAKHHTLHAMRCEALGFGVTLHPPRQLFEDSLVRVPAAIPAGLALPSFVEEGGDDDSSSVLTQTTIRDAVRALLEDDGYRRAAARVQDEIRSMPEPEQAVALLERVADA